MKIVVPKERAAGEKRVALVPESAGRLVRAGLEVWIESGAGAAAGFPDEAYQAADAAVTADVAALYADADVVARVQRPEGEEVEWIADGSILIALLQPFSSAELVERLNARGIHGLALERVPRVTRAQSMDVLSSQATVAGYKAVLLAASALGKFLPMLTTAAGSIAPARAFVIGAGVAGLQAIATARRLGAVVSGFDIRPAAAEQVQSLGAKFVGPDALSESAETRGGYAREQTDDEQQRTLSAIGAHIADQDLVVTTAQIPGRAAPTLITDAMLRSMRPGSVVVDLAAETGGNCESTRPGETIEAHGVVLMAPLNLPSTVPMHASQMFSRNVQTLLQHLTREGELRFDPDDEIVAPMLLNPAAEGSVAGGPGSGSGTRAPATS